MQDFGTFRGLNYRTDDPASYARTMEAVRAERAAATRPARRPLLPVVFAGIGLGGVVFAVLMAAGVI